MPIDYAARLEAIELAYYSGERTVKYQDRTVIYASAEEMRQIIAELKKKLGQTTTGRRRTYLSTRKGHGGSSSE